MLLFNARKNSQGFTLIEILTVLLIIGILAAIAVPSFLAMLNRSKVNNALAQVRGALQEAQREAMRKSKTCTVNLPEGNDQTVSSNCFITGSRTLKDISIDNSSATNPWVITFDFKGRTNDIASAGTVVFSLPNNSVQKKCLAVSQGLGLIRTGNYNESTSACNTSQR